MMTVACGWAPDLAAHANTARQLDEPNHEDITSALARVFIVAIAFDKPTNRLSPESIGVTSNHEDILLGPRFRRRNCRMSVASMCVLHSPQRGRCDVIATHRWP